MPNHFDTFTIYLEYPWTSNLAQAFALFSLSMVLLSTFTFIISTFEELQVTELKKGKNTTYLIQLYFFSRPKSLKFLKSLIMENCFKVTNSFECKMNNG